jgi:hypothetical protein
MKAKDFKEAKSVLFNGTLNGLKSLISKYFHNRKELTFERSKCLGFYHDEYLYYPKRMYKKNHILYLVCDVENECQYTFDEDREFKIDDMSIFELIGFINFIEKNL